MTCLAWVAFAVLSISAAVAQPLPPAQQQHYHKLIEQLRCVVCQNRSIADSDAPLAADLRKLVRRQMVQGRSDAQIKAYLVDRYGTWILYKPPFSPATWLLWLGPAALLVLGLVWALWLWRRTRRRRSPAAPDVEALARILDE
ncbi:MAG: cytochrome c-type biogenesis protein CcmH [Salinisphaera sp.]|nr:cytochrome c-type biogenesis protein CcmH [Salinisphaera sp.]MDN5937406.1 cytochrome c-type biogenesis protein CcmH [Salinisphaera sp.]